MKPWIDAAYDGAENPTVRANEAAGTRHGRADTLKRPAFSTLRRRHGTCSTENRRDYLARSFFGDGSGQRDAPDGGRPSPSRESDAALRDASPRLHADDAVEGLLLYRAGRSLERSDAGRRQDASRPAGRRRLGGLDQPTLTLPDLLRHAVVLTTSPRSSPPDLVTLFGAFLI